MYQLNALKSVWYTWPKKFQKCHVIYLQVLGASVMGPFSSMLCLHGGRFLNTDLHSNILSIPIISIFCVFVCFSLTEWSHQAAQVCNYIFNQKLLLMIQVRFCFWSKKTEMNPRKLQAIEAKNQERMTSQSNVKKI